MKELEVRPSDRGIKTDFPLFMVIPDNCPKPSVRLRSRERDVLMSEKVRITSSTYNPMVHNCRNLGAGFDGYGQRLESKSRSIRKRQKPCVVTWCNENGGHLSWLVITEDWGQAQSILKMFMNFNPELIFSRAANMYFYSTWSKACWVSNETTVEYIEYIE